MVINFRNVYCRKPEAVRKMTPELLSAELRNIEGAVYCTDEISISDANRHKTSLAIISMCLKMYCYECTMYMLNLILF